MRCGVFLDRDGVINRPAAGGYVRSWEEFEFLPGVLAALRELHEAGWICVVVTNQSCVAKGICSREALDAIHAKMIRAVEAGGGWIERVYYCPHGPEDECECRKPKPGLILRAASELGIDLKSSFVVGDSPRDIEAGARAGCRTILISADGKSERGGADSAARDLRMAVETILRKE